MSSDEPVRVRLNVEGFGSSESDTFEVPRAEWDAMTPAERTDAIDQAAEAFATNHVGWGWHIDNPSDLADTEDGSR